MPEKLSPMPNSHRPKRKSIKNRTRNQPDIKWNYEMKFGRVKDPIRFGVENWYCWDENLNDTNCPE